MLGTFFLTTEAGILLAVFYETHYRETEFKFNDQINLRTTNLLITGSNSSCYILYVARRCDDQQRLA